ncbi:MAG TPA: type II toxin-antitoxin system HicA family toxin [Hyphomicrobiaceae bacterium]|nr:type II toxin-antitoxin system HicA family toxin [Hyphomicrobiaceae bacterium]
MNHRHRKVLHALFAHPVSANINFKEVVHVLEELGAEVENKAGNRIGVTLNGHTAAFVHAQHDLPKDEVAQIRKFLTSCGVDPAAFPV